MRILSYFMLLFLLSACGNAGSEGSGKVSSGTGDWAAYDLLDADNGVQIASKKDEKGKLVEEGVLVGGQKDGEWVTYHTKNGIPATITNYSNGQKNGPMIKINDRGTFEELSHFVNDKLEGSRKVYDRTRVIEEASFKDGQLHGQRKLYYKDGKVKEEGVFKNGQRDGVAKWYNENEEVTIEMKYENGKKIE